jgi:hypothetical protein
MAKFTVEYRFGVFSGRGPLAVETVIGRRRVIVDAPNGLIARELADSCAARKKVTRFHKKLWGTSKKNARMTVTVTPGRWNNMG